MRLHAAARVVGVVLLSSCVIPPPSDGKLRINVTNLATRDPFTELDLHIVEVELFYGAAPPAASGDDCDAPGQTLIVSPPFAVAVDLTRVGDSFVGEFSVPPGNISEVRLVSDSTEGVEQGLTRRAHPSTRCGGGDTGGLFRLVPLPGQAIAVLAGDTTQIEVQLDPTRDITVDGQGGGYGQGKNNAPGSCGSGGPCGKPFKLASDYGVLAFVASAAKDWRASMANTPLPHAGCFRAVYPDIGWQEVPCTTAPQTPFDPAPQTVGGGSGNFSAQTTGLISQAVGSFDSVTGVTSIDSRASKGAGPFTLQVNANTFPTNSCGPNCTACLGGCTGWQQFIFDDDSRPFFKPTSYMQYWLIGFPGACPAGWMSPPAPGSGCFRNSDAITVPAPVTANFAQMSLVGRTTGGLDIVILSTTGGDLAAVGAGNMVNLQPNWNVAEFNVFGDGNSSLAVLNPGSTIVVRTAITDGTTNAPTCISASFTAETNTLSLIPPCCTLGGAEPAIVFTESDVLSTMSTCPASGCAPGLKVLADTIASNGADCGGTSHDYVFGQMNCDPGFQLGTCSATFVNDGSDNGSTCSATPIGGCLCRVHATTPQNCNKSVNCHVLVTEQPTNGPLPQIVINQTAHNGADCGDTSHYYDFPLDCDDGYTLGTCSAKVLTDANGSACTAIPIGGCGCRLHVTTPTDCSKFVSCSLIATQVPATWPATCSSLQRF